MPRWTAERWAASSGIFFAILLVVSNLLAGTPPHYNATADKIGAYFTDHHDALVAQGILGGVMLLLWLWFVASYAGTHRDAGQGRLATIMYGSAIAAIVIAMVGGILTVAMTHLTLDSTTMTAWYGLSVYCYVMMFWALAPLAFASYLSTHRSHVFPEWFGWLSLTGGVVFVLGGLCVRETGFFSPTGGMMWVGFVCFAIWAFVGSWLCMQKHAVHSHAMSPAHSH